jgi:hypothetical protein
MNGRRVHTRAAAVARRKTDLGTIVGTGGVLATAQIHSTIDRSQDSDFGAFVGQTTMRQREFRRSKQSERKSKERRELLDASPEFQDLLLEF